MKILAMFSLVGTIFVASTNIVPFGIDVLGVGVKMGVFVGAGAASLSMSKGVAVT